MSGRPCIHCTEPCFGKEGIHWDCYRVKVKSISQWFYYHERCHAEYGDKVKCTPKGSDMNEIDRFCIHCKEPCYGKRGVDEHWDCYHEDSSSWVGRWFYYHNRCHAEYGKRVKYTSEADQQLQWEKEKEELLEKHQMEVESYRKMLDYMKMERDEDRKEFMDAMLHRMEQLEMKHEKLETSRLQMNSQVARFIENSERKIIERMEQIESKREEKMEKIRKEVVSSVSSLINMNQEKEGMLKPELENIQFAQSTGAKEVPKEAGAVNKKSSVFLPRFP